SSIGSAQVQAAVGAVNYAGAVVETTAGIGIAGAGMIGGGAMAGAGIAGAMQATSMLGIMGGLGTGALGISGAWSSWADATGQPFSPGAQAIIDAAAGGVDLKNLAAHPSWENAG